MTAKKFNIRVYGILINDNNQVLVTDERIRKRHITKFPGGGLEFGEGTIECLEREFMEELDIPITVTGHFYTTDFFQVSAFHADHQLISIYYLVKPVNECVIKTKEKVFDFNLQVNDEQLFRWVNLDTVCENDFTFPIDKVVAGMLRKKWPDIV